jgi:hypothetical protein
MGIDTENLIPCPSFINKPQIRTSVPFSEHKKDNENKDTNSGNVSARG